MACPSAAELRRTLGAPIPLNEVRVDVHMYALRVQFIDRLTITIINPTSMGSIYRPSDNLINPLSSMPTHPARRVGNDAEMEPCGRVRGGGPLGDGPPGAGLPALRVPSLREAARGGAFLNRMYIECMQTRVLLVIDPLY